ncbi:hypothetical protein [Desulfosporosinus hippei]|uniref:Uncharacterized protein n=1 Tax=Desulfosporosinus hippei DSM 8344 TaxID=1121419 RepID=A0A1G8KTD9_9FIRM|nr:hypothetical protein [Desulfosporosinus hippei]SDI46688.1 hypothetical protein SAMN05443529_1415 [Desulfosporosinus hippei DSM 8344]
MDENIKSKNGYMDLASPVSDELSPYSATYPVELLSNGLKLKLAQAENIAESVYRAVAKASPMVAQVREATKKGYKYVVDATESTLEAIESGKIKLTTENSGEMYAQIREANGHYGSKLPIKKEMFEKGIDPIQMANALQMKVLQEQVQQIADQIAVIDHSVREVIQGQQNDRIGLYYSGLTLYFEARKINDSELKKALIAQSLRALSEATFQLGLSMQSDIKYLADGEFKIGKGKSVGLIDSRMYSINQSFAFIHQATMLRAGIYCNEGELTAMSTVLKEYSYFIDGTVAKNAGLLAQCDTTDTGTEKGVWKSRAKLKLDVSEFNKKLNAPDKTIYLGVSKENE